MADASRALRACFSCVCENTMKTRQLDTSPHSVCTEGEQICQEPGACVNMSGTTAGWLSNALGRKRMRQHRRVHTRACFSKPRHANYAARSRMHTRDLKSAEPSSARRCIHERQAQTAVARDAGTGLSPAVPVQLIAERLRLLNTWVAVEQRGRSM